ncbi:MAG TPA: transposase, partial [Micromonosporaceae bacterium]
RRPTGDPLTDPLPGLNRSSPDGAGPHGAGPNGAGPHGAGPGGAGLHGAGPNGAGPNGPPVLRVIDGERGSRSAAETGSARPTASDGGDSAPDGDLLIFSQAARTAWFTEEDEANQGGGQGNWGQLADDGWRAAEQVADPTVGAQTLAGLPRRVPQANLVPGSAATPQRQLRIVRDPQSIAAHTEGYFRGWRRGQQIGGFAVGQRDRAAWEFNRDQRARDAADPRARLS